MLLIKIYTLIIHYELGNENILISLYRSVARYIEKQKREIAAEKIILRFFDKIILHWKEENYQTSSSIPNLALSLVQETKPTYAKASVDKTKTMKSNKFALAVFFALVSLSVFADKQEVKVKSQIKEAKIFLSGAQLTNTGSANIPAGVSDLIFENLAADIDENSIQVKGEGDFTILSVARKANYLSNQPKPREIRVLEDSLEMLQNKYATTQNLINAFNNEEKLIMANQAVGSQHNGVNAAELQKMADFFRNRLTEIANKRLESLDKQKKMNEEIAKINQQLIELNNKRNRVTSDVIISVSAKAPLNAKFVLEYVVQNASWSPYYEIKAIDSNSPLKVMAKANVYQNTGMDWNNVKLTLSTGNPSINSTKPILYPWSLRFYESQPVYQQKSTSGRYQESMPSMAITQEANMDAIAKTAADYTNVIESQTNNLFEISIPYDIPSDGDVHAVDIQNFNLNASYGYYSAPKLDGDAFLVAKATGGDQNILLSGDANIFFEGTFVGKAFIDAQTVSDTVELSLGRDKNVVIKRTRVKEFAEKKFIGSAKKELFVYELSVRNKKKQEVEITIEDQVPLSTNEEIKVEVTESGNASYNKETGKLSWKMKISSGEDKKLRFGYSVQYPKDKRISGL